MTGSRSMIWSKTKWWSTKRPNGCARGLMGTVALGSQSLKFRRVTQNLSVSAYCDLGWDFRIQRSGASCVDQLPHRSRCTKCGIKRVLSSEVCSRSAYHTVSLW